MALPDYHIWEITEEDRKLAEGRIADARSSLLPAEFAQKEANGEFNMERLNPSFKFQTMIKSYIETGGRLGGQDKVAFINEMDRMIDRILGRVTILFTTCSNAGSDRLRTESGFRPTVITADETGQCSVANLCVPITSFDSWRDLFLFGDWKQLHPVVLSGAFNEFVRNAKMSFLELLTMKDFPYILLNKQYRMPKAVSKFLPEYVYENELEDHPKALEDTDVRKAARRVSQRFYNIRGPNGDGSEYWVINVAYGVSRLELNGTSMVNHANAEAMMKAISNLLTEKRHIRPGHIKLLTYYQGQARLIRRLIWEKQWSADLEENKAIRAALVVSTVDAFQGKEDDIIMVDFVAAREVLFEGYKGPLGPIEDAIDDPDDDDTEGYVKYGTVTGHVKYGTVTGHVKDPNRLCVALGRATSALILICQQSLLLIGVGKNRFFQILIDFNYYPLPIFSIQARCRLYISSLSPVRIAAVAI